MGTTCSFLTKREQSYKATCYKVAKTSDKETSVKTRRNYQKTRYLDKLKERNIETYIRVPLVRV